MLDYKTIIENASSKFPIRPKDINLEELSFGKGEVEIAARNLICFFQTQKRDSWTTFLKEEVIKFSKNNIGDADDDVFFGLFGEWFDDAIFTGGSRIAPPYIIEVSMGVYAVTDLFIKRCAWGRKGDFAEKNVKVEINITGEQGVIAHQYFNLAVDAIKIDKGESFIVFGEKKDGTGKCLNDAISNWIGKLKN